MFTSCDSKKKKRIFICSMHFCQNSILKYSANEVAKQDVGCASILWIFAIGGDFQISQISMASYNLKCFQQACCYDHLP